MCVHADDGGYTCVCVLHMCAYIYVYAADDDDDDGGRRVQVIYPHTQKDMHDLGVTDDDLAHLLKIVDPAQNILKEWSVHTHIHMPPHTYTHVHMWRIYTLRIRDEHCRCLCVIYTHVCM